MSTDIRKPGIAIEPEQFAALAADIERNKAFILTDGERTIELVPVETKERVQ
jgi:hypothetical protein